MSKIITDAAETTDAVQKDVTRVIQHLEDVFTGRIVNGAGVYSDPSRQRDTLVAVRSMLCDALERMRNTTWPSSQDYDDV